MKRQNIAHKDQFAVSLGSVPCRQIHPLKNKKAFQTEHYAYTFINIIIIFKI